MAPPPTDATGVRLYDTAALVGSPGHSTPAHGVPVRHHPDPPHRPSAPPARPAARRAPHHPGTHGNGGTPPLLHHLAAAPFPAHPLTRRADPRGRDALASAWRPRGHRLVSTDSRRAC